MPPPPSRIAGGPRRPPSPLQEPSIILRQLLFTLPVGLLGAIAFALLGLPAAWLAGSMVAVAGAALAGLPVGIPSWLRQAAFTLVGAGMGSAVTPATLKAALHWPLSMTVLAVSVVVTVLLGTVFLERRHGWDHATARFSSVPGALTSVMVLAAETGADLPKIAFAQSLRLLVLVAAVPAMALTLGTGATGPSAALPASGPDALGFTLLIAGTAGAAVLCTLLRVPAGSLIGAMVASSVLHGTGLIVGRVPETLLFAGFVVTGAVIGERFRGTRLGTIRAASRASLESLALTFSIAALFAALGSHLTGVPFPQFFLALAPGGIEAMMVMAFLLQLDPAFVGAHSLLRFLALSLLAPLWLPRRRHQGLTKMQR